MCCLSSCFISVCTVISFFFFFNDTATTEIYTLSLHDALPILLASPWKFEQHGQSGLWISELFPELAKQADELCLLRAMYTDVPAHSQAFLQMHTGIFQFKRPSMGAWTFYGLGTDNENLPGFVTVSPPLQNGGPANYGSAFLPAVYQGTPITGFRAFGPPGGAGGPGRQGAG